MKKTKLLIITVVIGLSLVLSSCVQQGPRVTGAPGLAVKDETIFVSYGSFITAMNAESHAVEWSFPESRDPKILFFAPPLVTDEFVYVGDLSNKFYKLDRETGKAIWTFADAKGFYIGQAAVDESAVYAPSNDGNLYVIDQDGKNLWAFETGHYLWAQPQLSEEVVYAASMDHFVYAISKSDGKQLWRQEMGGAVNGAPVLSEDGSILYVGSLGKEMVALDTKNEGKKLWVYPPETSEDSIESVWGKPILGKGTLYFADSGGYLYALDATSGKLVWPAPIEFPGTVVGGLTALEDGFVYATEEGGIAARNFDGTIKWERQVDGEIFQAPVVSGNYLVVGTINGEKLVYLYDLEGNRIWAETPEK